MIFYKIKFIEIVGTESLIECGAFVLKDHHLLVSLHQATKRLLNRIEGGRERERGHNGPGPTLSINKASTGFRHRADFQT